MTYEVGGASSPEHEFQRHGGQEWGYILSGTLGVTVGFDEYVLGPGDAITLDSTVPHRLYNLGHGARPRGLVHPRATADGDLGPRSAQPVAAAAPDRPRASRPPGRVPVVQLNWWDAFKRA